MAKLCFFICLSIVMSINAKIVIKNDASPEMNDFSDDEEVSLENDIVKFQLLHSNSDDFDEYLVNRAEAHVEHLIETNNVKGIITYTLGARLPGLSDAPFSRPSCVHANSRLCAKPILNTIFTFCIFVGDQLVAHSGHNQTWPSPQNVATTLSYPAQGVGAQVTYVAIQVNQVYLYVYTEHSNSTDSLLP